MSGRRFDFSLNGAEAGHLQGVSAVLFDAVGTLIECEPSAVSVYAAAAARDGLRLDGGEVERRFRAAFARQESIDRETAMGQVNEARERDRWRSIVAEVFRELSDTRPVFEELWIHFADPAHWRLFEDVAETWRALAERGFTLGVASNFDSRLDAIWDRLSPLAEAHRVFVSSRIGWRKPFPGFFRAIAEDLGVPAESLLMIGDDHDNDIEGATAQRWRALRIDRRAKTRRAGVVRDLRELLGSPRDDPADDQRATRPTKY